MALLMAVEKAEGEPMEESEKSVTSLGLCILFSNHTLSSVSRLLPALFRSVRGRL